ncbi:MAG TPA: 30S ribosome-binding factor RbfA [Armatimonadota bacterium]|nr:30S ribosome-binding factor RbfA [Armatimonadota bacterium]
MASTRLQRVGRVIKEELSRIIREEIDDPRLGLVSITGVEVTPDLRIAHVHVSVYGDEAQRKMSLGILDRASRFLRGVLGREIELRYTPELHFHLDTSLERGARIFELLHEIKTEEKENPDEPS